MCERDERGRARGSEWITARTQTWPGGRLQPPSDANDFRFSQLVFESSYQIRGYN